MLFKVPVLTSDETAVLGLIREQWKRLQWRMQNRPAAWLGSLRRSALARGIRGSNSIEGYVVSDDDSAAAVEGDEPYDALPEAASWLSVIGYREAMTHALQQGSDPDSVVDSTLLRGLHFMMMKHEPGKHPGSWRPGPIWVNDERIGQIVYEAPTRENIPRLMKELVVTIANPEAPGTDRSPLISAAMAHLNLAMIHPFSDGNGRMARCLQTLVLAKVGVFDPVFCSVEEWLGVTNNTSEYYGVLAEVGGGSWKPSRDARPWIRFTLKAHYQQAATAERRQQEASDLWAAVEAEVSRLRLPERSIAPLYETAYGRLMRNSRYRYHTAVGIQVASRDLAALVKAGLLQVVGAKRGRYYSGTPTLREMREKTRRPKEVPNPFDEV